MIGFQFLNGILADWSIYGSHSEPSSVMGEIQRFQSLQSSNNLSAGPLEVDLKYQLITVSFSLEVKVSSVKQLATLRGSERMVRVMSEIQRFQSLPSSNNRSAGPLEVDPEYQLIVEANNLAVEIDNEISKFCDQLPILNPRLYPSTRVIVPK